MTRRSDDFRIRPGRVRDGGKSSARPPRFFNEVVKAARKAGHTGYSFGSTGPASKGATFGRGAFVRTSRSLTRSSRRVVVATRVVRHRGARYRSAPLATHLAYLQRDGVDRDGRKATMFGRDGDGIDGRAFAEACEEDRHHFRFIVSPEDAHELEDLRAFTRDLMARAERDLGTRLDWAAVDHWNTDNPHVHVLVRGRTEDGQDLVISRDYISRGFRARAEELAHLELGPRSEREIATALERQVTAERWTDLDRALRSLADDNAGFADLRPGAAEDPLLRRLMIGRAQTLEELGLAERAAPAVWELKPGAEATLRELGMRGDIIKTMHRAMAGGPERAVADFAIEGMPQDPILGRLVERGPPRRACRHRLRHRRRRRRTGASPSVPRPRGDERHAAWRHRRDAALDAEGWRRIAAVARRTIRPPPRRADRGGGRHLARSAAALARPGAAQRGGLRRGGPRRA